MAAAFSIDDPRAGDAAWEAIRLREIGYVHTKMGAFADGIEHQAAGGLAVYGTSVPLSGMIS